MRFELYSYFNLNLNLNLDLNLDLDFNLDLNLNLNLDLNLDLNLNLNLELNLDLNLNLNLDLDLNLDLNLDLDFNLDLNLELNLELNLKLLKPSTVNCQPSTVNSGLEQGEAGGGEAVVERLEIFFLEIRRGTHLPLTAEAPVFVEAGAVERQERHLFEPRMLPQEADYLIYRSLIVVKTRNDGDAHDGAASFGGHC